MTGPAKKLRVMILCGRSPRHLYVANTLSQAAVVVAIVQETGAAFSWKKLFKTLRPDNLTLKVWRWLRDRRRYTGNREGKFFFGDAPPRLDRPELCASFRTSATRTSSNWRGN